jgi:hypothetical protein
MGLNHDMDRVCPQLEDAPSQISVDDSTPQTAVPTMHQLVDIDISAQDVSKEVIPSRTVKRERERILRSLQPKYLRCNTWTSGRFSLSTADWTLKAPPLPSIPINERNNPITSDTIHLNPTLFCIITPINIDRFESLLSTHPNQPFVKSVCKGLREGFWPWADTLIEGFPVTHDESQPRIRGTEEAAFLRAQVHIEQEKHRFSSSFCSPVCTVCLSMLSPNLALQISVWSPIIALVPFL